MSKITLLFLFIIFEETIAESCLTAKDEIGDCIPIFHCPEMLRSYENPNLGNFDWMDAICDQDDRIGYFVCCSKKLEISEPENNTNVFMMLTNHESCGVQPKDDRLLQTGTIATAEFPWLVGITTSLDNVLKVRCTGALINARYVLTTAYCLIHPYKTPIYIVQIEDFHVKNKEDCPDYSFVFLRNCTQFKDYHVEKWIVHEKYNPVTHFNDIGLLRLATLVSFEDYIRPICLPLPDIQLSRPGDLLYTAKWNNTSNEDGILYKTWSVLKKALTTLISDRQCKRWVKTANSVTENDICSTKPGNDTGMTCEDMINSPLISMHNNRWYIEGITRNCTDCTQPVIHTKIQIHLEWIRENMRTEQCTTPNGQQGEYKLLPECAKVLDAFANPQANTEDYLWKFLYTTSSEASDYLPVVCCGIFPNFTVYDNESSQFITNASVGLGDPMIFKYCGQQNRDGYYSENENVTIDEFPWAAAIYNTEFIDENADQYSFLSGGAVISRRYVLTRGKYLLLYSKSLVVRLGEYQVQNKNDCSDVPELDLQDCTEVVDYGVEEVILHPFREVITNVYDVGLLRLNKTIMFSDYIRPICLPSATFDYMKEGDTLYSTGWGILRTITSKGKQIKKKIATTLVTNERCKERHLFDIPAIITAYQFCTQDFTNGTDFTCDGDSGSPVMFYYKARWYVIGLSSTQVCNDPEPQIHTKVSTYLQWIYRNIKP